MELKEFCFDYCLGGSFDISVCTERDYVDCRMYPKRILELEYLAPTTVLLSCIFLSGLVGNLCVCVVIAKHPVLRSETNAYLFSLAISDLLLLVFGLPPELWSYWKMYPYTFGAFFCRFNPFMAATGTYSSVLTVVAFSVERYEAICYPLRTRSRRVATALCAVWAISVAAALPILHVYNIMHNVSYPPSNSSVSTSESAHFGSEFSKACGIPDVAEYDYYNYFYVYGSVLLFFIPMIILLLAYTNIAIFMRKNLQLSRNCGIQNSCSENQKTFKMLAAVVLAFFICGAPYHYQRVFTPRSKLHQTPAERRADRIVLVATSIFYYFSATINPILYNAMSKRYRKAFIDIFWTKSDSQENTTTPSKRIKLANKTTTTYTLVN